MELKNSFSILMSKINTMYAVILYVFLSIVIMLAIGVSIFIPLVKNVFTSIESEEIFDAASVALKAMLDGDITLKAFVEVLKDCYLNFHALISSSSVPVAFWIISTIMFILLRFAISTSYPVIGDLIHNFMSSNMSYGYLSCFVKNLKKCLSYGAFYTLITVPMDMVISIVVYLFVYYTFSTMTVFTLVFGLIMAVVLFSLRVSLFSGVLPIMIVDGEKSFVKAFRKSFSAIKGYYKKLFASVLITIFTFYAVNATFAVPTFGIAAAVFSAVSLMYLRTLELVYYYGSKNMRYYTDAGTVVNTAPLIERIDLQEENLNHDE